MPKTVVALEATFNTSGAENNVKSLRAQLKEAQAEVAAMADKFGDTSVQAANAAKKAAELKDKIGDAKALTDAFSPDKKFQAFSQALTGVAGGFAAVQGAMGLMNVKSEEVEKTLLKVQSALALSQGLSAITEAQDAFKNLGTVAVTTFNKIRAAIGSTGLGLLVVTIGIAVTALIEYAQSTDSATLAAEKQKKAEEDLKNSIDETNNSIKERNSLNEYELQLALSNAKAKGASIKELRKIEADYWYQRRLDAQTDFEDAQKQVADLKAQGYIKGDLLDKANKNLEERRKDYYDINQKYNLADAKQREEDFVKNKENVDKNGEELKQANLAALKKIRDLKQQIELQNIADEDARAKRRIQIQLQNDIDDINSSKASQSKKNEEIRLLKEKAALDIIDIDNKLKQKLKENDEKAAQDAQDLADKNYLYTIQDQQLKAQEAERIRFEKKIADINKLVIDEFEKNALIQQATQEHQNILTDIEKNASDQRVNNANAEKQFKLQIANDYIQAIGIIGDLVGKQTALGKALAIAQIAGGAATAYINGLNIAQQSAKGTGPAAAFAFPVFYASQVVSILGAIAKAKAALSGGVSSISSSTSSIQMPTAPVLPQVATTTINQGQVNQLANATARAFVLESDISGNQERIQRLNRAARIN